MTCRWARPRTTTAFLFPGGLGYLRNTEWRAATSKSWLRQRPSAGVLRQMSSFGKVSLNRSAHRSFHTLKMTATRTVEKEAPSIVYLKDYKPPAYLVDSVDLDFDLRPLDTQVHTKLVMRPNEAFDEKSPLVLTGHSELRLIPGSLIINGKSLPDGSFTFEDDKISIPPELLPLDPNEKIHIETRVLLKPAENTALEGLYVSGGNFCTQCEAEGFRRITFYPDRPDVMATFTTKITADRKAYPVLLGNGNKVKEGLLPDGDRHYATYHDPWPKPCYLFALVAGNLVCTEDTFKTMSGRDVDLKIFVRDGDQEKTGHAMDSLKRAMRWDEEIYGREYDLDIFNIVAVDDFNMGAMENKSLNIFNSRFVLVSPETATDVDFNNVEGVIAHEYFHNWTGNRITCRDWFQLSLKEGLTVFRDQCFSADMKSKAFKRISDVASLRAVQFVEDAGPMAHPIRPDSFIEINNFYTMTVYQKGAEVIRMLHTILGPEGYRKGTDLFFERHDGQAITCDDWLQALQDANPHEDLSVFRNWYSQAGTPVVTVEEAYNAAEKELTLKVSQETPNTPGQDSKLPVHIPIKIGLIGPNGEEIDVNCNDGPAAKTKVLNLKDANQTFVLSNVPANTRTSLLRDFSAPVRLVRGGSNVDTPEDLSHGLKFDRNEFTRWESGQVLALNTILGYMEQLLKSGSSSTEDLPKLDNAFVEAFRAVLLDEQMDPVLVSAVLTLPSETYITQQVKEADPVAIHRARDFVRRFLAAELQDDLEGVLNRTEDSGDYKIDAASQGRRGLHNTVLGYLCSLKEPKYYEKCLETVRNGKNMTDVLAALGNLAASSSPLREVALEEFYAKWKDDNLVVLKWLGIQAIAPREDALDIVEALMKHEAFDMTVPNKVYAVIGGLCGNAYGFHIQGSRSYKFLANAVLELDALNPQVASRMAKQFTRYRMFTPDRQQMMRDEIEFLESRQKSLSADVYEVVKKSLA